MKENNVAVAVFAREWLGLGWPLGRGPTHHDSRVIAAMLECLGLPAILVMSIYLKTGIGGATPYNFGLLQHAGQLASLHRMPWMLGGDFQIRESWQILNPAGTCVHQNGSSFIDFFIVSEDLAQIAEGVRAVVNACTAPHRPAFLPRRGSSKSWRW